MSFSQEQINKLWEMQKSGLFNRAPSFALGGAVTMGLFQLPLIAFALLSAAAILTSAIAASMYAAYAIVTFIIWRRYRSKTGKHKVSMERFTTFVVMGNDVLGLLFGSITFLAMGLHIVSTMSVPLGDVIGPFVLVLHVGTVGFMLSRGHRFIHEWLDPGPVRPSVARLAPIITGSVGVCTGSGVALGIALRVANPGMAVTGSILMGGILLGTLLFIPLVVVSAYRLGFLYSVELANGRERQKARS